MKRALVQSPTPGAARRTRTLSTWKSTSRATRARMDAIVITVLRDFILEERGAMTGG